ncbi:MAG: SRPBCC family protein [Rhizobiales bacterium]|nr:SRPBCC family protein [Hyphomicrobiales bacterium]
MMMTPFYIVLGIGAVMITAIVVVLILASMKPNQFRVERSIDIAAPASKIFPYFEDLKQQRNWSPWDQKDPDMKRVYSGADKGVGAVYAWDGNREVGAGQQEIISVRPNEKVEANIDFYRPMRAKNHVEFLLKPAGNGTKASWIIFGPMPFISRVMSIFMSFDKMIGNEFEKGLLQLKVLAEK